MQHTVWDQEIGNKFDNRAFYGYGGGSAGGTSALAPYMGTSGLQDTQNNPAQQAFGNWQNQQQNAATFNTAPQGGYGASAVWGNYLRQQQQQGGGSGDQLAQQRQLAFAELERQRLFYDSPEGKAMLQQAVDQAGGMNSPWDTWQGSALADASDTAAGQYSQAQDQYNREAANAGVKVGGRMFNAARDISGQNRKARRDITSTAATQEDARRERGRMDVQNMLRDRATNAWQATQANVGLRSRFEVTGQGQYAGMFGGSNPGLPSGTTNALGGGSTGTQAQAPQSSYGGVTIIPGLNAAPWSSGGSSSGGGSMGFDLSKYSSYPAGTTDRYGTGNSPGLNYSTFSSPYAKNLARPPQSGGGLYGY